MTNGPRDALAPPNLPPYLRHIVEQPYPRFTRAEYARRRTALERAMAESGVDYLLVYGANRSGSAVHWLTGWPATAEAAAIVTPGAQDAMFVQYHNHVVLAQRMASDAEVRWGGPSTIETVVDELRRRGAAGRRIGFVGPLGVRFHAALTGFCAEVADLNAAYTRLRLIKSAEEIDWLRVGAALSDLAVQALRRELRPGLTERELWAICEAAYVPWGGTTVIHFFGTTSMSAPDCAVPRQFPTTRRIATGDVVFTEISAAFWDYSGQILRTFTVDAEPAPLYRELYGAAEEAFRRVAAALRPGALPAEIVEAASVIEEAGFTSDDDLVHGYGGGYLPPILGTKSRPAGKLPDMTFEAGMTVVVQPNVTTRDGRAGVQVGELLHVTADGTERLHAEPMELFRTGS